MAKVKYTYEDVKSTYKEVDAPWTVFGVDPFVTPLIYFFANYTTLSPTFFTIFGMGLAILSFFSFLQGTQPYLIVGAILFELAFWCDCIDGKLARLTEKSSPEGAFFELLLDQGRMLLVTMGIAYGQFRLKGDYSILIMGLCYVIFHFFWFALWNIWGKANRMRLEKYNIEYDRDMEIKAKKEALKKNNKPKGLRNKIGLFAFKHRILARYSSVEIDTVVFLIFPILSAPITGLKVGLILWALLTAFKTLDFSTKICRPPKLFSSPEDDAGI
ncbi:MAG: CDP-alcohol phosphatidyltransferase family protein [Candidatus Schekmanbacteria bacterium]|nr:MAG: CDP-alcohol phosphatidyltransferase family protein [Candidatus Schekmanbacteria bacterium]